MSIHQLLTRLRDRKIRVWAEGERLLYEAPSGALDATLKSEIVAHKKELLTFLKQVKKTSEKPVLQRYRRETPPPLSYAQQRLWFLEQLLPETAVYNVPIAWRLQGTLDVSALRKALETIVQRHDILRTTFHVREDIPHQHIIPDLPPFLTVEDWTTSLVGIESHLSQLANQPFDLTVDPLFRAYLFQVSSQTHYLLLVMHHIVVDGWSLSILLNELKTLYTAFQQKQPNPLPYLPIQYADYAIWQREWLTGQRLQTLLTFWQQQLADTPPTLILPTDFPRPTVPSFIGQTHSFQLSETLSHALQTLARTSGVTLFMLLLTAFKILLYRYSQQPDIVVGTPIANRTQTQLDSLIGFFVNTLVLRTDLSGSPSFGQLLQQIQQMTLQTFEHQDLPFERLVEHLQPHRDLTQTPLFQVMFTVQNAPHETFQLANIQLTSVNLDVPTSKFDLTLSFFEHSTQLSGSFNYNAALFTPQTIERMQQHLLVLLQAIVSNPDQSITQLCLLADTEQQQLLTWAGNHKPYPQEPVAVLFERQVAKRPLATALLYQEKQLTYQQLNEQANQLAHHLKAQGVQVGEVVGIYLQRSLDSVIATLAILKAGATYLPLDPTYPESRITFMLEDATVHTLITHQAWQASMPVFMGKVITLDTLDLQIHSNQNPKPPIITPPAYIMYTSGSTGQPKGALIPQSAINRLVYHTNYINIEPNDCFAHIANIAFDATTFEIWGALLHGARLIILEDEVVLAPNRLASALQQYQVSALFITTALFNKIIQFHPEIFSHLTYLLFGGEVVNPIQVAHLLTTHPPTHLLHVYGPTENTTFSTWYEVQTQDSDEPTPIGQALTNSTCYVLDKHLQLVPFGVAGELYVGGDGLALGYLNRPALTASRFIPNPFSDVPGQRLYRTSDQVRRLPDGNLLFLGRFDYQVKLRGFRIELGEIETCLQQHPHIAQALVTLYQTPTDDKQLIAYLTTTDKTVSADTLRRFLQTQLPAYMIPTTFMFLPTFPLTPNGKVDRQALPQPQAPHPTQTQTLPRNEIEKQLAYIWQTILDVKTVGIHENFFDLGGHSLLAIHLISRIEQVLGYTPPLSILYQGATIAQIAQNLKHPQREKHLVCLQEGTQRPLFLVHPRGGHVFAYVNLTKYLDRTQTIYGLQALYTDDFQTIPDMARQYIEEIQTVQSEGPYQLGGWSMGGLLAFEIARQLEEMGHKVWKLILIDAYVNQELPKQQEQWSLFNSFAQDIGIPLKDLLTAIKEDFPIEKMLQTMWQIGQQKQLLPTELSLTKLRQLFAIFKRNTNALLNYKPVKPVEVQSTLLIQVKNETKNGWNMYLPHATLRIVKTEGNHFTLIREPYTKKLAQTIQNYLRVDTPPR